MNALLSDGEFFSMKYIKMYDISSFSIKVLLGFYINYLSEYK